MRQKQAAEIIQRETIEKIKSLPGFNDEINTLYWELIIKATFDNPDVDEEQLGKYLQECVNCPFLRDSRLWERTEEALSKGVMSFSWEIKDLSIEIKEVPLFIDGEVDPDFYPFWLQNKDKYEKK